MNNAGIGKTAVVESVKVGEMEYMQIKDIPPNIAEELERLHDVMAKSIGIPVESLSGDHQGNISGNAKMLEWSRDRIDKIHGLFFNPTFKVKENE